MDKNSIAYQDTFIRVNTVWKTYADDVAKNEALSTNVTKFGTLVVEINDLNVNIGVIPTVIAQPKHQARVELEDSCLTLSGLMHILAVQVNDLTLVEFLVLTISAYHKMRSAEVNQYAQALMVYIVKYQEQLSSVGIGDAQVTDFSEKTQTYSTNMEEPKETINKRKDLLVKMKKKVEEGKKMLDEIFDFMIKLYPSDSDFVIAYKSARVVVDPGTRHQTDDEPTDDTE